MSQTINIPNYSELNIIEKTNLDADAAAAQAVAVVKSAQNIAINHFMLVGQRGAEGSELRQVQGVSGFNITMTAVFAIDHDRFDQVIALFGNKIRVYRAANVDGTPPADGSFSLLATVDIDYDQVDTGYTDAAGGDGYWYKFTYYNATNSNESSLGDVIATRGTGTNHANYASIESIRAKAGLTENRWITDAKIEEKRQTAQQLINSKLTGIYTLPFTEPINPLIAEITRLLAAGWLLTDNYGPLNTLDTNEGQQMINQVTNKDGTGILDRLNTKDLELTDEDGQSIAIPGSGDGFSMWPDADTATTLPAEGGGERMFETGGWQGYGTRKY